MSFVSHHLALPAGLPAVRRRTRAYGSGRARSLAWLLAGGLLLAPAATAQQTVPPPSFGASVDVELVEVEVFVSDAQGSPVGGLGPTDFELRVDGERRDIAGFYEAQPQPRLSAAVAAGEPSSAQPPAAASPPVAAPERQLSLVVLVDDLHLQASGRKRTLDRLAELLAARAAAGDRVMIATLDRSLEVRRSFSAEGPLAADLEALEKRAPGGINADVERRHTLSQIRDFYADNGCQALPMMQAAATAWTESVEQEARLTLSLLEGLLHSLAGRSGRKALLYVTEGLPLTPGLEAQLLLKELCGAEPPPATGLLTALSHVTATANAAQVTLYTLDAGGQRTLASAIDGGPGLDFANQSAVRADAQNPAFALAADTGGKALLESNHPERMVADLAQDFAAFYSLAFTPRPADAGRSHRVQVAVRRPGLRVRHRSAWDPVPASERLQGRLLAALRWGGEDSNPLQARLETGPPQRGGDGTFTVALHLTVPASALTLLPRGERRQGNLRVLLAVQDGSGRTTPVRELPLPVDLPALAPAATDVAQVPLEVRLKLGAGRNTIAVAVRDEVGQETSVLRRELTVGSGR